MECDGFPTGYLKCYITKTEIENKKKITRDGTIFSLTGKKHEEQPKN
jgi:hypothetical protein